MMLVSAEQFTNFLFRLNEDAVNFDEVIVPYRTAGSTHSNWGILDRKREHEISFGSYRTLLPLKFLFYPPLEQVYPENTFYPKRIIAGVKACDLKALHLLDLALIKGNFIEPSYSKWRDHTTIISTDCKEISSTCHCTLLNGKPYSSEGYDINLTEMNGYYELTSGSEKGKILLDQIKLECIVVESTPSELEQLKDSRKFILHQVLKQNADILHNNTSLREGSGDMWKKESVECVGCGACTNSCPTCYCLILNDESVSNEFVKVRSYDSCQWYGYARVAGGGTPRPKMYERFRNRYLCKFDYMKHNFLEPGCTGCGRCIEACAAGIDFRTVLNRAKEFNEEPILT